MGRISKLVVVVFLLISSTALADPPARPGANASNADWINYFSGGPLRVGQQVDVQGFGTNGSGWVMADVVITGDGPSRHQYLVVLPPGAGRNWAVGELEQVVEQRRRMAPFELLPREQQPLQRVEDFLRLMAPPRPGFPANPAPAPALPRPRLAPRVTTLTQALAQRNPTVVTVEVGEGGRVRMVGLPMTLPNADDWAEGILNRYMSEVMQNTAEGRRLDADARRIYEQWAARADVTRNRYTTASGYARIGFDIAVAGVQPVSSQRLGRAGNFMSTTLQQSAVSYVGSMDMFGHPSTPPFDSRESAAVTAARELANSAPTRANINAYLRMALTMPTLPAGQGGPNGTAFTGRAASAPLNPSQRASRDAILTDLAVQFAGRLASSGRNTDDDAVARDALAAIEDIAVEYALPRVPVVTVLARDALELTRQLRGFLEAQGRAGQAGERFTAAINAFNRSYAARQYFAMRDLAGSEPLVLDPLWLEPGLFEEGPLPGRLGSGGFNGSRFGSTLPTFPSIQQSNTPHGVRRN